jgi:hypothetical protein
VTLVAFVTSADTACLMALLCIFIMSRAAMRPA